MSLINEALRGGLQAPAPTRPRSGGYGAAATAVVVGGVGALGAAVLSRVLAAGGFAEVAALVTQPVSVAIRGFAAWPVDATLQQGPAPQQQAHTAVVVFDQARQLHGREAAFLQPQPEALLVLGRWLQAAGVQRLVLVMPHAPTLLPQALRAGLASLDEQALAALGFAQLVIVRPARAPGQARQGGLPDGWLHRVGRGLLAQLHWMVPQREQPLRAVKVAQFVGELLRALPEASAGTRVVPPELVWDWAQAGTGGAGLLHSWLREGRWQPAPALRRLKL